jgi:hypothetical protein
MESLALRTCGHYCPSKMTPVLLTGGPAAASTFAAQVLLVNTAE